MRKCKYTGEVNIQNGPHGQGTAVREDGYRIEGTFKDGSLVKGKAFDRSGALLYEGEFSGGAGREASHTGWVRCSTRTGMSTRPV